MNAASVGVERKLGELGHLGTTEKKAKQKKIRNKYKQYVMFLGCPRAIRDVDMFLEFANCSAIDRSAVASEPPNLRNQIIRSCR
jgi:hypothetical protein